MLRRRRRGEEEEEEREKEERKRKEERKEWQWLPLPFGDKERATTVPNPFAHASDSSVLLTGNCACVLGLQLQQQLLPCLRSGNPWIRSIQTPG